MDFRQENPSQQSRGHEQGRRPERQRDRLERFRMQMGGDTSSIDGESLATWGMMIDLLSPDWR
jgi:hypothetical protein